MRRDRAVIGDSSSNVDTMAAGRLRSRAHAREMLCARECQRVSRVMQTQRVDTLPRDFPCLISLAS